MKRTLAMLLAVLMIVGLFAGCGNKAASDDTAPAGNDVAEETLELITTNPVATGSKNGNVTMGPDSDKKTMVVVASKSFETLDPMFASGAVAARQRTLLWDTLWDLEMGAAEEVGLCAKEWTFSEDKMTVYVTIHEGIYDSENNPIKASDFEWFYNKYLENKTLANLTSLKATGEYTLEIGLKYAYYPGYLYNATQNVVAMAEAAYDADRFVSDPVTSGKYKPVAFTSGASATFMQTYNWWGEGVVESTAHRAANVDVCRFDVITENAQIQTALSTNAIQAADITAAIAQDFKGTAVGVQTTAEPYPAVFMLNNAEGDVFAGNKALREAFAYALDYESMMVAATNGAGKVTGIMGHDGLAGWSEELAKYGYSYDVEKAKAKLEEAGYKPGELTLDFVTNVNDSVGVVMQACLAEIGINLNIVLCDETRFLTVRQQAPEHEWDILFLGTVPKGFLTNMLDTLTNVNSFTHGNYCGVYDEELYNAVVKARYSQDPADIEAAYAMTMERLYYVPTWVNYGYCGTYSKVESVVKDSSLELIAQAAIFADDYDVYYEG